jgi:hypothetical protein
VGQERGKPRIRAIVYWQTAPGQLRKFQYIEVTSPKLPFNSDADPLAESKEANTTFLLSAK